VAREGFWTEGAERFVGEIQCLAIWVIYYKNNPFLGTFQLKFCLKDFETCSLLYVYLYRFSNYRLPLFLV